MIIVNSDLMRDYVCGRIFQAVPVGRVLNVSE